MSYLYIETNYPVACMFEKFLTWWTVPSGGLRLYFGLYNNSTSGWQYFSGNATHGLSTGSKLVNRGSSEATAQSAYLDAEQFLNADSRLVCILPQVYVAKKVRVYVETGHAIVLKHWIAGERLNAGELVTGNITMTDQYKSPPKITVTASANDYLKIGKLNATDFGIKGFDINANKVFEISDADLMLGGKWDLTGTLLASDLTIDGNISKITTGTGNYVAVNDGLHSTYRFYVGNASPTAAKFKIDKDGSAFITHGSVAASIITGNSWVAATQLAASSVDNIALAGGVVRDAHLYNGDFNFDAKVTATGKVEANAGVWLPNSQGINFATASVAEINHTGTDLFIDNSVGKIKVQTGLSLASAFEIDTNQHTKFFGHVNTQDHFNVGNLSLYNNLITNTASTLDIKVANKLGIKIVTGSTLDLYHNNTAKARTISEGFRIIGAGSGNLDLISGGSSSTITNATGNLNLVSNIGGIVMQTNSVATSVSPIAVSIDASQVTSFTHLPVGPASVLPDNPWELVNKEYVDSTASIAGVGGLDEWHEDASGHLIPNALGQDIGTIATPIRSLYVSASTLYIDGKNINASQQDHTTRIVSLEASVANLTTEVNSVEASLSNHTTRVVSLEASVSNLTTEVNSVEASVVDHTTRIVSLEASIGGGGGGGGLDNWSEAGTSFIPDTSGQDIGSSLAEIGNVFLDDDSIMRFGGPTYYMNMYHTAAHANIIESTGLLRLSTIANSYMDFYTNSIHRWRINNSGEITPAAAATYDIGSSSYEIGDLYLGASKSIYFGAGQEFLIRSGGTSFYIETDGNSSRNLYIGNTASTDWWTLNCFVDLSFNVSVDNTTALSISSTVMNIYALELRLNTGSKMKTYDDCPVEIGNGNDLTLNHNSNNSFITHDGTGSFYIQNQASEDLYMQSDRTVYIETGASPLTTTALSINASQLCKFHLTTEDIAIRDAGSSGASGSGTVRDWIEVTIGTAIGYVKVYDTK